MSETITHDGTGRTGMDRALSGLLAAIPHVTERLGIGPAVTETEFRTFLDGWADTLKDDLFEARPNFEGTGMETMPKMSTMEFRIFHICIALAHRLHLLPVGYKDFSFCQILNLEPGLLRAFARAINEIAADHFPAGPSGEEPETTIEHLVRMATK